MMLISIMPSRDLALSNLHVRRSVLGMLPLAVLLGKGAELYQGLGIALTGGLALSTFLTPTVIPASMGLLQDFQPRRSVEEKEL